MAQSRSVDTVSGGLGVHDHPIDEFEEMQEMCSLDELDDDWYDLDDFDFGDDDELY